MLFRIGLHAHRVHNRRLCREMRRLFGRISHVIEEKVPDIFRENELKRLWNSPPDGAHSVKVTLVRSRKGIRFRLYRFHA